MASALRSIDGVARSANRGDNQPLPRGAGRVRGRGTEVRRQSSVSVSQEDRAPRVELMQPEYLRLWCHACRHFRHFRPGSAGDGAFEMVEDENTTQPYFVAVWALAEVLAKRKFVNAGLFRYVKAGCGCVRDAAHLASLLSIRRFHLYFPSGKVLALGRVRSDRGRTCPRRSVPSK